MAQVFTDEKIASTFRKLNATHEIRESSRAGVYASWFALVLLVVALIGAAIVLLNADRHAESVRLEQAGKEIADATENRLISTSELLQKASIRLMHLPGIQTRVASSDLTAQGLMQDRREIIELALVDDTHTVMREWTSPSRASLVPAGAGALNETESSLRRIDSAFERHTAVYSELYTLGNADQVFVNVFVPTPAVNQVLVARLSVTRVLEFAADGAGDSQYISYFEKDGMPLADRQSLSKADSTLFYSQALPVLGDPAVRLVVLSERHSLFALNKAKIWAIFALAALLAITLTLLFRNQREQQRAHRRLVAEYSLRVAMSESALAGIRVTDREGRILFVNETFQKLVGYSADELFGAGMPYPYWEDDVSDVMHGILMHPEEHHVQTIEFRVRRRDGAVFDAQLNISPLTNEGNRVIGWISELYDISEQKRARERMKAAHERFTRVVQSMNSAICVITTDPVSPRLLFHNAPYETLFGNGTAGAERLLKLLRDKPALIAREGVYDEESGRWFDARIQMLTWTDDTPARMIIATDITAQRETMLALEAQLKRAETTQRLVTMGEMASSLAHELNQPLAAISNYAIGATCMLEAGKLSREDTIGALNKMNRQAQRAAAIIKRIRAFAAAKKTEVQLVPTAPETVVSETMELALIQADKLHAKIETVIEPGLPDMHGDAVMLEQLLLNLLKNAMEAALPCKNHTVNLTVDLTENRDFIRFRVADHGPGIPDEAKAQLFDAFYSTKNEGMGMGLNICRSIIEAHQGRILVTDTEGGGATFTFTIPLAKHENTQTC